MRIAYVCADPGVPVFGTKGSSVHVQEVIRALLARGAEVEIFATRFDGDAPDDLREAGVRWLSALPKGNIAARERASLGGNLGLLAMLRGSGPFDLVYERYSLWSYAGMEYAREMGVPGVLEVNAPLIEEQERHRVLIDRGSAEEVAQRVFDAASAIVVVSREVASYLDRYVGASDRLHVVPNGVNAERFTPDVRAIYPRSADVFTVGFVGTLKPWHGLPVLSEAFSILHQRHADARLVIGGDGPERIALETDFAARGLSDYVTFTGALVPATVPSLLTSFDVAVAPYPASSDFYFSPLKVYEYMSSGLPVVASAIGQIPDVITDGVNGVLCEPGDAQGFAQALERLREPELRTRLGRAARDTILQAHTWPMVVERIITLAEDGAIQHLTAGTGP